MVGEYHAVASPPVIAQRTPCAAAGGGDAHTVGGMPPPPSSSSSSADSIARVRGIFLESYCGLKDVPARIRHELRELPWPAIAYILFILLVDLGTVVLTFIARSPDESVYRALVVVYMTFHFATTIHSVYAQNAYTFAAANLLLLCVTLLMLVDYLEGITGFDIAPWLVIAQCLALVIASILATATYEAMEGFGWRTFRDYGTRQDRIAVHEVYHKFTATLSLDFLLSIMLGLLTLLLVSWPVWVYALASVFLIAVPLLLTIPLKKTVKAEMRGVLKGFAAVYLVSFATEVMIVVLGILEEVRYYWRNRLVSKNFPTALVVIAIAVLAVIVRAGLAYRVKVVVDRAFGQGCLKEVKRGQSCPPMYGAITVTSDDDRLPSHSSNACGGGGGGGGAPRPHHAVPFAVAGGERQSSIPSELPARDKYPQPSSSGGRRNSFANGRSTFLHPSSTPSDPVFNVSWTPTLGPVPIVTAKSVSLSDKEHGVLPA